MLEIPEYFSLRIIAPQEDAVQVTVKIDGSSRIIPPIEASPEVLARLVEAFFSGRLQFMSFDEHPKRLTGISLSRPNNAPKVLLTAKSLTEADQFPSDWCLEGL